MGKAKTRKKGARPHARAKSSPKKSQRVGKNRVTPTPGPRLNKVPREYGNHTWQVTMIGRRTESFPFVTETGARGCFEGAKHEHSKVITMELQRRKTSSSTVPGAWTTVTKWRRT